MKSQRIVVAICMLALLAGAANLSAEGVGKFGVIGASNTRNAIEGYEEVGGTMSWHLSEIDLYGGGTLAKWATTINDPNTRWWNQFIAAAGANPDTTAIWFHVMIAKRAKPGITAEDIAHLNMVLAEIERYLPGVEIYFSPLGGYEPDDLCRMPGRFGDSVSQEVVDYAVSQGLGKRGPDLAEISPFNFVGGPDTCHQGYLGKLVHGDALRTFFDQ